MQKTSIQIFVALLISIAFATPASAQSFGGAFEGMSNNNEPIQIEADRLEVLDNQKLATFNGNVKVVQGSTILKAANLKVFYLGQGSGNSANGKIKRIEAGGKVAVRSKDQHATADKMVFDMQAQIVTLSGDVAVSQGNNIITGCVLLVYLKTNTSEFKGCRTKILLEPNSQNTN